jgi:hypothetical protein
LAIEPVTASYVGRAAGGAILLADGIIHNSPISIVVAALFLPFLSQVLAVGFGLWCGDRGLMRKGAAALLTSAVLAYAAGAVVAVLTGGPIGFQDFKGPFASFAISAVIGAAAGLSTADDAGRRYLIGVAAAIQFAVFSRLVRRSYRYWPARPVSCRGPHRQLPYKRCDNFGSSRNSARAAGPAKRRNAPTYLLSAFVHNPLLQVMNPRFPMSHAEGPR